MRKLLQRLFRKPVTWLANKVSSSPDKKDVFSSLDELLKKTTAHKEETVVIPFDIDSGKFIIFSDMHKGAKDLADDFRLAENNYMAALKYYYENGFTLIMLGDCEELWENKPTVVVDKNRLTLLEEAKFLQANRYYRIFGNHDLEWKFALQQTMYLKPIFGPTFNVLEGIVLETVYNGKTYSLFLTHGHQGDKKSDGNAFSMWVVAAIWTPIQRFLEISIDTVSDSFELVDRHNIMMYEWSATQNDLVFISGHTHKPVFASLDHIDRLAKQLEKSTAAKNLEQVEKVQKELDKRKLEYAGKKIVKTMAKPTYFNSGCCCFNDGDITGIEITNGTIRLIKWETKDEKLEYKVLEESPLFYIFDQL